METEERFWNKVDWDIHEPNRCWPYLTGTLRGYGAFWFGGNNVRAHRFAYELEIGEVPTDMFLDHTCHDPVVCKLGDDCPHRKCCNPNHLKIVTNEENNDSDRSNGITALNKAKTYCVNGHEFTTENTYVYVKSDGRERRSCRLCAMYRAREKTKGYGKKAPGLQ